ncbi:2-succinylbenzoate--CoA ligase [Cupriavidus laharis]|uniref:2-succinylbenzoate--CoA ligase n=1 Tax=Cupriavidus laharis TaxID=151654 RepID=A0ABM8WT70_9BURK|nr:AMP-binding protein [Cupriavidus laharis]CAG9170654.1 2-succinylbenzoate--CoA ligase [Cupriavidus laharis]
MTTFALLSHPGPDSVVAWQGGQAITASRFVSDVHALAARLPAGKHVFNACTDRYRFAVGLCAALLRGKVSLLPSSQTPDMVRQLAAFAPDVFCLHDDPHSDGALPRFFYDASEDHAVPPAAQPSVPEIPAERLMAYIFTSGSTGQPVAHAKTWGAMVRGARATAQRLGLLDGRAWTLVGTLPPQHMFGLEATVMLALQAGAALASAPAFYPADIRAALHTVPRPRALVTSPVHLRALLQAGGDLPPADLVLSATAPLGRALAGQARHALAAPLLEIYGSTETGALATRATADTEEWTLLPGIRLESRLEPAADGDTDAVTWAAGGHIDQPVALGDAIGPIDAARFLLHGRKADMIKIAGKRTSLAYLNQQLTAIDGVQDGTFYLPDDVHEDEAAGRVVRLVALAVAPGVPATRIVQALRGRVDAAFLPRPLCLVDRLPRNAAGKLPREALALLVAAQLAQRHAPGFVIDAGHPALAGHFPGNPVVPGVVLLDHAILQIGAALGRPLAVSHVGTVKFLSPVRPGERVEVNHQLQGESASAGCASIRFTLSAGGRDVASGTLSTRPAPAGQEASPC